MGEFGEYTVQTLLYLTHVHKDELKDELTLVFCLKFWEEMVKDWLQIISKKAVRLFSSKI